MALVATVMLMLQDGVEDKKKLQWMLMPSQLTERISIPLHPMLLILSLCCRAPFPAFPARTTLSTLKSLRPGSPVKAKWMEVTTLMEKLSARFSIFAQLMELEVWPSTASSAPTEPSSTRTTSSAIGGSTSTVLKQRTSILSMMISLLNVLKLMLLPPMLKLLMLLLPMLIMPPLPSMVPPKKSDLQGRDHSMAGTAEDRRVRCVLPFIFLDSVVFLVDATSP